MACWNQSIVYATATILSKDVVVYQMEKNVKFPLKKKKNYFYFILSVSYLLLLQFLNYVLLQMFYKFISVHRIYNEQLLDYDLRVVLKLITIFKLISRFHSH